MKEIVDKRAATVLVLLEELESILNAKNERNWLRGIQAAIAELQKKEGRADSEGFENARSIYLTMIAGGRGFSEYFIWDNDEDGRFAANAKLDQIRERLWVLFNAVV
ncbi:hypothetical protein [Granulibacter bethesdensis]|nr:hypothetical protein [Granulibacter bethesdensis]